MKGRMSKIKKINFVTGETVTYDSIRDAAKQNYVSMGCMYNMLKDKNIRSRSFDKNIKFEKVKSERASNSRTVYKVDKRTSNIEDIYTSCTEASRENGVAPTTMSKWCRGTRECKDTKFRFTYKLGEEM